jgi:hypothetical protein
LLLAMVVLLLKLLLVLRLRLLRGRVFCGLTRRLQLRKNVHGVALRHCGRLCEPVPRARSAGSEALAQGRCLRLLHGVDLAPQLLPHAVGAGAVRAEVLFRGRGRAPERLCCVLPVVCGVWCVVCGGGA